MPDNGFTEHVSVLVDGFNMSTLAYGWTAISIFPFTAERIWAAEVYSARTPCATARTTWAAS
jgi:hypothetical protein